MVVRVGVMGAGEIATTHFDTLASTKTADVRGICDIDAAAAHRAAERFGAAPFTALEDLLDETDIDALFLCVPPDVHGRPERLAAERGIDLFVEKPIARRTAAARSILEAIEENDVLAAAGHNWRYAGAVERANELLADRRVGYLDAHMWGSVPGGADHWWRRESSSGGQVIEQGIQLVDTLRALVGDVDRVWAAGSNRLVDLVDFPDTTSVTLEHESGVLSHVSTSCAVSGTSAGIDVIAEDASFTIDRNRLTGTIDGAPIEETFETDPYTREVDAFLDAVSSRDRAPIRSPYTDAIRSLAVTEAATLSMERTEPVVVADVLGE